MHDPESDVTIKECTIVKDHSCYLHSMTSKKTVGGTGIGMACEKTDKL